MSRARFLFVSGSAPELVLFGCVVLSCEGTRLLWCECNERSSGSLVGVHVEDETVESCSGEGGVRPAGCHELRRVNDGATGLYERMSGSVGVCAQHLASCLSASSTTVTGRRRSLRLRKAGQPSSCVHIAICSATSPSALQASQPELCRRKYRGSG